jgi:hypothetical protein
MRRHHDPPELQMTAADSGPDRVGTLRGAGVQVDARRLGRIGVHFGLVALASLVVVLFVAGVHKNAQIDRLRHDGVPVAITVTGCVGQLGGSGSNAAGYACTGTFTLRGHSYRAAIPGTTLYPPGSTVRGVAVPADPALMTTVRELSTEHTSWKAFVTPGVLLVVLLLALSLVLGSRRRRASALGREALVG